jgi:hypothetical protein
MRMSPVTTDERSLDSLCVYDVTAIFANQFRSSSKSPMQGRTTVALSRMSAIAGKTPRAILAVKNRSISANSCGAELEGSPVLCENCLMMSSIFLRRTEEMTG